MGEAQEALNENLRRLWAAQHKEQEEEKQAVGRRVWEAEVAKQEAGPAGLYYPRSTEA